MRLKGNQAARNKARQLRRTMSLPETVLWLQLRRFALGVHFRNQHPAGPYILDFYCAPANLAVEVDSFSHECGDRPQRDERRDRWLAEQGVRVLRIMATDVLHNLDAVITYIRAHLPPPPPDGGPLPRFAGEV